MAPTLQNTDAARKQRPGPGEKRSDLVCRVKYCNTLPDIPFDPKFITYPFSSTRFVDYKPTSLERNYKHDLLTEHDLGVTIDLINPETYAVDETTPLHPDDERLLEEDTLLPQDTKRSRHHNKSVPWLKKTEYISHEFNRYGVSSEKTETKVGYNVKKLFREENLYMDRESQINAINNTFLETKKPIEKHHNKPNVYPVEELPVFPDFQLWRYPFAQVIFDAEPVAGNLTEEMSQAMIRGVVDDSGEQFVAYFLPTDETMKKRKRDSENGVEYDDDDQYEYKMAREYNWNVKNKASKGYEENYFFVFRDGAMYYNELETRVRLNKRRLKPGVQTSSNSKLVIRHRPLNEAEFKTQECRMLNLEPPPEEEEEEEEEENEMEVEENAEEGENEADKEKGSASSSESEGEDKKEEDSRAASSPSSKASSSPASKASSSPASKASSSPAASRASSPASRASSPGSRASSPAGSRASSPASRASSPASRASSPGSRASSPASKASSSSSSESEAEEVDQEKRDEEEIFGSD